MNHSEWAVAFTQLWRDSAMTSAERISALSEFRKVTESFAQTCVGNWHKHQVTSMLAKTYDDAGNGNAASELYAETANKMELELRSLEMSIGHSYAEAAMIHFRRSENQRAFELARRALQYLGRTADPSSIYCELLSEMHSAVKSMAN